MYCQMGRWIVMHLIVGDDNEEESEENYEGDGLELFEPDDGLFRIPGLDRDSDDFLMIEYAEPEASAALSQPWSRDSFLPFSLFEESTSNVNNDVLPHNAGTFHLIFYLKIRYLPDP